MPPFLCLWRTPSLSGSVLHRQTLSFYFRPMEAWRDPGGRMHLLGIGRDKATGLSFPIQYLAVGKPREDPAEGEGEMITNRDNL